MANDAIAVRGLTKIYEVHERPPGLRAALRSVFHRQYRQVRAVDDISFTIQPGERVGFLGPNGAGKTTTLKTLSGLLHPSMGEVTVGGFSPGRRDPEFLQRITLVMGQKQQLLWDLPPVETFALNRAIYEIPDAEFNETMKELSELLGLDKIAKKPARQLSLGERMKCELAAALLHRPDFLFLDEPTIGLDVSMQLAVREFIRHYCERRGATLLLTSHYMDDVAALCPRVIVIDQGKIRYDGTLESLVHTKRPHKRISARFSVMPDKAALEAIGKVIELEPGRAVLEVRQEDLRAAMSKLLEDGVVDLTVEDPPLEDVMRELFAEPKRPSKSAKDTR